jgi:hypothetical protein
MLELLVLWGRALSAEHFIHPYPSSEIHVNNTEFTGGQVERISLHVVTLVPVVTMRTSLIIS